MSQKRLHTRRVNNLPFSDRHKQLTEQYTVTFCIQGVTGGTDQTSGECSLGQTIPI